MFRPFRRPNRKTSSGFSLVELMIVLVIMVILAAVAVPALGLNGSQKFSQNLTQIVGVLEQARSAAVAQNTYVWVVFYPVDPSSQNPPDNSGEGLYVATFASDDGSNPFTWNESDWSGNVAIPAGQTSATASGGSTTIKTLFRLMSFPKTAIRTDGFFTQGTGDNQIAALPSSMPTAPTPPAASPTFSITVRGVGNPALQLPQGVPPGGRTSQPLSVVLFTPGGAARVSNSPIDSIWIDFQRVKGRGVVDDKDIAAVKISGLTGLTTLYRK